MWNENDARICGTRDRKKKFLPAYVELISRCAVMLATRERRLSRASQIRWHSLW